MKRRAPWIGALAALLLASCAHHPISLEPATYAFTGEDYERLYRAWTRDADDFAWGELRDVLLVTATFEAPEFRWAYIARYAEDHGIGPQERTEMLRASLADAEEHHRFFITLAGDVYREANLVRRDSAWRVLLVDESGRTMAPSEIERIRRPSAAERVYFPSINVYRHTFRLVFPTHHPDGSRVFEDDADKATLRFTGARGTVDLVWDFENAESGSGGR